MTVKISVCIPVYNPCFEFLEATLHSVLSQQGDDFNLEVVLSDDASTSNLDPLLRLFSGNNIKYWRNSANQGMVANWNLAVTRSTGNLIILLSQDDVLLPGMFDTYTKIFHAHSDIVLCSCGRKFINSDHKLIHPFRAANDRKNIFLSQSAFHLTTDKVIRLCLRNGNVLGEPSSVMYRRWAFESVNGYDANFSHAADLDFNLRIAGFGRVAYNKQPYLLRRLHKDNLTKKNLSSGYLFIDRIRLHKRFVKLIDLTPHERSNIDAYMLLTSLYDVLRAILNKNWAVAKYALIASIIFFRLEPVSYTRYFMELITNRNNDAM